MKQYHNLHIEEPCNEDFSNFTKTQKGGFCQSCTKEVIDFTNYSNKEISIFFKDNSSNTKICGRFKNTQLLKPIQKSKSKPILNFIRSFGLACLTLLSFSFLNAQKKIQKLETNDYTNPAKEEDTLRSEDISVKGIVIASSDGLPLPGVNIILSGTAIGTQTNFDGYFEFPKKLKKGDVLMFSFVTMKTQKVVINNQKSAANIALKVDMEACDLILMGEVARKDVYNPNKTNKQ